MKFVEKLKTKYGTDEPIFYENIAESESSFSRARVYQLINSALEGGDLAKFGYDCYYIPTNTPFGKSLLNPRKVIEKKYIESDGEVYGYYTGLTLLNSFGVTTQMPNVIEIYSNNEATKCRRVKINNQTVIVKRARTKIDNSNYRQMMILELFNIADLNAIDDAATQKIVEYIRANGISYKDIMKYADAMPARAIKNFVRSEVANAIA